MFTLEHILYKDILNIEKMEIEANQITCILGRSGSGKSTLLKLLNKLISPDAGTIHYQNRSLTQWNAVQLRRQVVMLPQRIAIYPGTLKDNLLIGLQFAQKPSVSNERLQDVLQAVHLSKPLDTAADILSGGEVQRLGLARVLLLEPDVFLLDEPSSALDATTEQRVIEDLVAYTKAHHKTLVMVTHSATIATQYADTIIELPTAAALQEDLYANHH